MDLNNAQMPKKPTLQKNGNIHISTISNWLISTVEMYSTKQRWAHPLSHTYRCREWSLQSCPAGPSSGIPPCTVCTHTSKLGHTVHSSPCCLGWAWHIPHARTPTEDLDPCAGSRTGEGPPHVDSHHSISDRSRCPCSLQCSNKAQKCLWKELTDWNSN